MARGTTLGELIDDLRAEVGHSVQASLGKAMRDVLIVVLQRTQRRLWNDYSWPFLRVKRDISMATGQRYYSLPADVTFERIERVEFKWGDRWEAMDYGIGTEELNQWDSDRDIRSWPIYRYDAYDNSGTTQLEVWPVPSTNADASTGSGNVRIHGIRNLGNFISSSDKAELDDQLLVLYAASEILARQKQPDAQAKLSQANAHYMRLKARSSKTDTFILGGNEVPGRYIPKGPPVVAITTSSS
mgnify:CR=1 FL=1|tara:strand:+ start:17817 stop:18545 length:729 start_codon:yes stop_codon:yes gene_type:complete